MSATLAAAVLGLNELQTRTNRLQGVVDAHVAREAGLQAEVIVLEKDAVLLTSTSATFDKLVEILTIESVGKVEQLVTHGLRTVFTDQDLSFRFEVSTKFREPWMEPRLIDNGVEAPILDAFGGGPAVLVAFILRLVVISRMHLAPVVLLDEPFSMVSDKYLDRVGLLLRDLCRTLKLTILMVTHQPSFIEHADHAYRATGTTHDTDGVTLRRVESGPDTGGVGRTPDAP